MKSKNIFAFFAAILMLIVAFSAFFTATVFAANDETEILLAYDIGDPNLDGKINIKDATAIQKHVAKLEKFTFQQLELADADKNGKVNVKDATYIQKLIAGLIEEKESTEAETVTEETTVPLWGVIATTAVVSTYASEAATADETEEETMVLPTETTIVTEATDATEDDDFKPITLPFVPAD